MTPRWEHHARGKGGGFAALEALLRRVAGVSRLYCCNSPRLLAVRTRFGAAWRPKCRPPRRQTPTMGCCGRGGLRCGHNGARPGVSLAREPLNMRGNPLDTHVNLSTCARAALPTRKVSGPGAHERARVCGERTSSEQFRMQFEWVNFQQCLQTLQFQRCECVTRHGVGGIACDILR